MPYADPAKNQACKDAWRKNNPQKASAAIADWRSRNKERIARKNAEWREANRERIAASDAAYRLKNSEKMKAASRRWRKENPGKVNARTARRTAALLQATPPWADLKEIEKFYIEAARLTRETGIPHEVDHYYPLRAKNSCGLHIPLNLRVTTRAINRSKQNKMPS